MYESLHVAVKMYINYSFYIYRGLFATAEVCNLCIVVILPIWKIIYGNGITFILSPILWRHGSRDHWIGHGPFPIGLPLVLTL